VRIFLAVFPPPAVQRALADAVEGVRQPGDGVSWVRLQNFHYTLRFLGEVEEARIQAVTGAARDAVQGAVAFRLALSGAGAFPDFRRPRVLWIGARQGGEALELLARSLEEALRRRGFGRADKPFRAHLTVGRVRDVARASASAERLRAVAVESEFLVDRLATVHSTLRPSGSEYRIVDEAPLGGPPG